MCGGTFRYYIIASVEESRFVKTSLLNRILDDDRLLGRVWTSLCAGGDLNSGHFLNVLTLGRQVFCRPHGLGLERERAGGLVSSAATCRTQVSSEAADNSAGVTLGRILAGKKIS